MVSYKSLYEAKCIELEALKQSLRKVSETDYLCPICQNPVLVSTRGEYYCSSENCKFDKTDDELMFFYMENHRF